MRLAAHQVGLGGLLRRFDIASDISSIFLPQPGCRKCRGSLAPLLTNAAGLAELFNIPVSRPFGATSFGKGHVGQNAQQKC